MKTFKYPEDRSVTLGTAIAIGLGITVHRVFFLIAMMIVAVVPFGWFVDWLRETQHHATAKRRHA